jgi:DNA modification methylase
MIELYQGNCLEVMPKLDANSIDLVLADPPYGTTACKWDTIIPFDEMWGCLRRIIKDLTAIALFGSEPFSSALRISNIKNYKYDWIWVKNASTAFQSAKYRPLQKNELISIFGRGRTKYNPIKTTGHPPTNSAKSCKQAGIYHGEQTWEYTGGNTDRYPVTVLYFKIERGLHPTQKPVALMEYLIKTYTNKGDTVLDFTMGSGTTGVACINTDRNFIGIEKNPEHFKTAQERINSAHKKLDITGML